MRQRKSLQDVIQPVVDAGQLAGAAALVWRDRSVQDLALVGARDLTTRLPMERDTIFRLASMTKPITSVAALSMLDDGRFTLDEPITRWAPEFAHVRVLCDPNGPIDHTVEAARPITFRDLLTHRSGLTYADLHRSPIGRAYAESLGPTMDNALTPDEWIARLATLPLVDQPGEGFHYGHSTDLLGFLLARLDRAALGAVLKRRVFDPLGMRDTGFIVPVSERHRRAGLCGFDDAGALKALSRTPGDHAMTERPEDMTFEAGGQGLWSTLDDYLVFARMLLGDGPALLRPETLALMTSNQLTDEQRAAANMFGQKIFAGHGYGMGVAVVMDPAKADPLRCRGSVGTIGWPGAYGGWWQADPVEQSVAIFLTHNMVEARQMMQGIGLAVWATIAQVQAVATAGAAHVR